MFGDWREKLEEAMGLVRELIVELRELRRELRRELAEHKAGVGS